jgi:hypothetical protein
MEPSTIVIILLGFYSMQNSSPNPLSPVGIWASFLQNIVVEWLKPLQHQQVPQHG